MFASRGDKRNATRQILGRMRRHFVGGVVTLAATTALNALLSIALLPLATRHLGVNDYGIYGLLMSIVVLVGSAADGGASLLVPAHYGPASASERARLFVSLAMLAGTAASTAGLLLIILWTWQHGTFSDQTISLAAIVLSAVLMPMRAITNVTVMIFSVTGCGPAIAAQAGIQSLVVFVSTLAALFEFGMGGTSLFIGALCGQLAALCVGLVTLGRQYVLSFPSRKWFRRALLNAPTTAAAGLVDGTRGFAENTVLTSAVGLHAVGILSHARLYHGLLTSLANAVGYNLWTKSLEEARNPQSSFEITRRAWTPFQIIVTCAGIIFAFAGKEIVDLISNGKFTAAAGYIPALFIIALVQTAEQPASAIVCTSSRAASAMRTRTIMTLGSFVVLYPTIMRFGIMGVLAVCIVETVAYRLYLRVLASRERHVPFQDHVAVFGSFAIMIGTAYAHWAAPLLATQLILMAIGIAMLVFVARRSISEMISSAHQILLGRVGQNLLPQRTGPW